MHIHFFNSQKKTKKVQNYILDTFIKYVLKQKSSQVELRDDQKRKRRKKKERKKSR